MKKPKGNKKKSKPKKKWMKLCGDFSFKNIVSKPQINNVILVEVFYKEEFIGCMSCLGANKKHPFTLTIYSTKGEHLGDARGEGVIHGLPKSIKYVNLRSNSILSVNRKVLFEKLLEISL